MAGIAQLVQRLAMSWTVKGSNPSWGEIFCTCPDRFCSPPSLLYNRYQASFPEESGQGMELTTHSHLAPTCRAVPLLPLWALKVCYRKKFTLLPVSHSGEYERATTRNSTLLKTADIMSPLLNTVIMYSIHAGTVPLFHYPHILFQIIS